MKTRLKHSVIVIPFVLLCIGFGTKYNTPISNKMAIITSEILISDSPRYATEKITLKTNIKDQQIIASNDVLLQLSSSYGTTVLREDASRDSVTFTLPSFLAKKTGWIQWKISIDETILGAGSFEILPNKVLSDIAETYIGPPSIIAGGIDFTMIVAVPTDQYDNMLLDNTLVTINEQEGANASTFMLPLKNRIAWKRIFSPDKKGRLFANALLVNSTSKEVSVDVFANQPQDFAISYEQPHPYADGNQIVTISTSILKDAYGNIVTDGTLVQFIAVDESAQMFRSSGTTINGVATAKFLYPDAPNTWKIQGDISGIASSKQITVDFKSILKEYDVVFTNENRTIIVGPLKSYMGQLIPDGATVVLSVSGQQELTKVYSKDGFASFTISEDFYPAGAYEFTITALGISQKIIKSID